MSVEEWVAWAVSVGWKITEIDDTVGKVLATRPGRMIEWEMGLDGVWRVRQDRRPRPSRSSSS